MLPKPVEWRLYKVIKVHIFVSITVIHDCSSSDEFSGREREGAEKVTKLLRVSVTGVEMVDVCLFVQH